MEYKGKLYGKVHQSYFPLIETTEDIDRIKKLNAELIDALENSQSCIDFGTNAYRTNKLLLEKIKS